MTHSDDWWDDLYRDDHQEQDEPDREQRRMVPRFVVFERRTATDPDQRRDARARALGFNTAAAGLGWITGYLPWLRTIIDDVHREASPRAAVIIGLGIVAATYTADRYLCALLERVLPEPFRVPVRFLIRIPLASAVLALLLYAPGYWEPTS